MAQRNDKVRNLILQHLDKKVSEVAKMATELTGKKYTAKQITDLKYLMKKENGGDVFAEHLEANGFNGETWRHGWLKVDGASIFIRNPEDVTRIQDMLDEHIERIKKHAPNYQKLKRSRLDDGLLQVVSIADPHIGKLCVLDETGYKYDIKESVKRIHEGFNDLMGLSSKHGISKIVFAIGNDVLHVDNNRRTTTAGTPQDTDGQWIDMYHAAFAVYTAMIEEMMKVADVHVVHCMSNHDEQSGFTLAHSLKSWFHKSKNVTFDITTQPRKYIVYGLNLIVLDHGHDGKLEQLQYVIAKEAHAYWSQTRFRYCYRHHIHSKNRSVFTGNKKVIEKDAITVTFMLNTPFEASHTVHVETLRSPSPPDKWHAKNMYLNEQAVECFLHHPTRGQIGRFTVYI